MLGKTFKRFFYDLKIYWLVLLAVGLVLLMIVLFVMSMHESNRKPTKMALPYQGGSVEVSSVFVDGEEYFFVPSFVDDEMVERIKETCSAKVVVSGDVPTLFVNTASGTMKEVYNDKEHEEPISFSIIDECGILIEDNSEVKIKGRGNSTWREEKKPFHVKFEEKVSFLGMEENEDWILLANAYDKSLIRNAVVLDVAHNIGLDNTVEYRYVDLYLNGEYNGVYMLTESVDSCINEDGKGVVICCADIPVRLEDSKNSFLLEPSIGIEVNHKNVLDDDIDSWIGMIREADKSICAGDPDIGKYIDIDSWVTKYLIDEMFENIDAGVASSYFYWYETEQGNSAIYGGPIWDYDNCLGNKNTISEVVLNPRVLFVANKERGQSRKILWYKALYDNPVFCQEIEILYRDVVRHEMLRLANGGMLEKEKLIKMSKMADRLRWGVKEDSLQEITEMQEWLSKRIEFVDSIWLEGEKYYSVILEDEGQNYKRFSVPAGGRVSDDEYFYSMIKDLDIEWLDKGTGEVFDLNTPIHNDVHLVKAEKESGNTKNAVKLSLFLVLVFGSATFVIRENVLKQYC